MVLKWCCSGEGKVPVAPDGFPLRFPILPPIKHIGAFHFSPAAHPYTVSVLGDACTTVSDILHRIALRALTLRVPVHTVAQAMG